MAQAGYTPIQLYYSTTASTAPLAANLVSGELAINILDEKLYFKNSSGTVKVLASSASVADNVTVGTTTVTSGTSGYILYNNAGTLGNLSTTGSGNVVLATSPTLVTPVLGTPTSGTLTNCTGYTTTNLSGTISLTSQVSGTLAIANGGTNITTYTTGDILYSSATNVLSKLGIGTSGQILTVSGGVPAWGAAPSTGLTVGTTSITSGTSGYFLYNNAGTLANAATTGSGSVVLATSPTLVTPVLGTPTSVTLTNATGLPLTTGVTGTLPVANGGTGSTTLTANSVMLGNGTSALSANMVAPGANGNVLTSNGTTWVSQAAGGSSYAGYGQQVFTSSGTFTVPTGVTRVVVTVIGAGGGTYGQSSGYSGAAGAGAYCKALVTGLTSGGTVTVTVGTAVRQTGFGAGNTGGTSSFGSYVTCTGGGAGGANRTFGTSAGGSGGTVTVSGATALFSLTGGAGGACYDYTTTCFNTVYIGAGGTVTGNQQAIQDFNIFASANQTFLNLPLYPALCIGGYGGIGSPAAATSRNNATGYGNGGGGNNTQTAGGAGGSNGIVIVEY